MIPKVYDDYPSPGAAESVKTLVCKEVARDMIRTAMRKRPDTSLKRKYRKEIARQKTRQRLAELGKLELLK